MVFEDFDLIISGTLSYTEAEDVVDWFDTYDINSDSELSSGEFYTGLSETFGYTEAQSDIYLIMADGIMGH